MIYDGIRGRIARGRRAEKRGELEGKKQSERK
jgi:hypothetical protein